MASCDLLLTVSLLLADLEWCIPKTADSDQSHAAGWFGISLVNLVENVSTVDEIGVAGERNDSGGLRRCFWSFCRH